MVIGAAEANRVCDTLNTRDTLMHGSIKRILNANITSTPLCHATVDWSQVSAVQHFSTVLFIKSFYRIRSSILALNRSTGTPRHSSVGFPVS